MSSEQAQRLLHPKTYGEYFTRTGMTTKVWQRDWVACGGMQDGGYSSDAPSGSATVVLLNAGKEKRRNLAVCMKAKGYEYDQAGPWSD